MHRKKSNPYREDPQMESIVLRYPQGHKKGSALPAQSIACPFICLHQLLVNRKQTSESLVKVILPSRVKVPLCIL